MAEASDRSWMALALEAARAAAGSGEVPVGAVVVRQGELLATEHNRTIELVDPTAHAEVLALRLAARRQGNYRLADCELFVTVEPCAMCVGAAIWARVARVAFGCRDEKAGAAGSLYNIARDQRLNHTIEVTPGVLEEECRALLQTFFRQRRWRAGG